MPDEPSHSKSLGESLRTALSHQMLRAAGIGVAIVSWLALYFMVDVIVGGLIPELEDRFWLNILIFSRSARRS